MLLPGTLCASRAQQGMLALELDEAEAEACTEERALDLSWVGQMADQKHRLADSQMVFLPLFDPFLVLIVLVTWIHSPP